MRNLIVGLLVGAVSAWAIVVFVAEPDRAHGARTGAARGGPDPVADGGPDDSADAERELRARIRELEEELARARASGAPAVDPGEEALPRTEEEIRLLEAEVARGNDLDALIRLVRALLLQGEAGYPRLTRVLMQAVGKTMSGTYAEDEFLRRIVPLLRTALRYEEEVVGYVGYLLEADNVPGPFRTGALGAAMFLSVNDVAGSEAFAPRLLEKFLEGGSGDREQDRLLVTAMGMLGREEAIDPLVALLDDPERQNMHQAAVEALGRIGDPRVVPLLEQRLESPTAKGPWGRMAELTALARIGTRTASTVAEEYLAGLTEDKSFFWNAGRYLEEQPSPAVVRMVRDRFRASPGAGNMWLALRGLQRAGTPEAIATLREVARTSQNTNMRSQAERLLEQRKTYSAEGAAEAR